jgi:hypothetical protein
MDKSEQPFIFLDKDEAAVSDIESSRNRFFLKGQSPLNPNQSVIFIHNSVSYPPDESRLDATTSFVERATEVTTVAHPHANEWFSGSQNVHDFNGETLSSIEQFPDLTTQITPKDNSEYSSMNSADGCTEFVPDPRMSAVTDSLLIVDFAAKVEIANSENKAEEQARTDALKTATEKFVEMISTDTDFQRVSALANVNVHSAETQAACCEAAAKAIMPGEIRSSVFFNNNYLSNNHFFNKTKLTFRIGALACHRWRENC